MLVFVLCALSIFGPVAKATNQTAGTPGERHENHFRDQRERMDHLEDKLDAATCKLDKQLAEITEKLHSYGTLLDAKLETLDQKLETMELKLEKSVGSEMKDQLSVHQERMSSMIKLLLIEQRPLVKEDSGAKTLDSEVGASVSMENQIKTIPPSCSISPAFENQIKILTTDACIQASEIVVNRSQPMKTEDKSRAAVCDVSPSIGTQIEALTNRTDACIRAVELGTNLSLSSVDTNRRERSPHEWITILRRVNGQVNFSRNWDEYKSGFGDLGGEFWLGLEDIHQLTSRRSSRLRVVLTDYSGEVKFAEYSDFFVRSEDVNYRLYVSGYVMGSTAGDSLKYHSGMDFSTQDRDNDKSSGSQCAIDHTGGWWYKTCEHCHLTSQYLPEGDRSNKGIAWHHAYGDRRSFKAAEMSIREALTDKI